MKDKQLDINHPSLGIPKLNQNLPVQYSTFTILYWSWGFFWALAVMRRCLLKRKQCLGWLRTLPELRDGDLSLSSTRTWWRIPTPECMWKDCSILLRWSSEDWLTELTLSDQSLLLIEQHLTAVLYTVLDLQHLTQGLVLTHLVTHRLQGKGHGR